MKINNKKKASRLKRIFFLVSVLIAIVALIMFLLDYTIYGIAAVGVFSLWFLYFHVAEYLYLEFSDENNRIVLRYFKAVKFGKGEYSSIDFPQQILRKAHFENSIFGKLSDLTFIVKTKRGMAEYPSVSLSAMPLEDRKKIQAALNKVLGI